MGIAFCPLQNQLRSLGISTRPHSCPKKHHRRSYVEEVYVAPRPVSRHSHHSHHHHGHGGHGRSSYTSVTRTSRPVSREYIAPRMSQSSYRRSVPVVVEQRHSTRSYR